MHFQSHYPLWLAFLRHSATCPALEEPLDEKLVLESDDGAAVFGKPCDPDDPRPGRASWPVTTHPAEGGSADQNRAKTRP